MRRPRRSDRRAPSLRTAVALVVVALTPGAGGCSRDGFEDRTARVTIDGKASTFQLDSCGLDGATLFIVGRSPDGAVLQAVAGLGDDRRTGATASTGLTVTAGGVDLAAFGAEAWARRRQQGAPPGRIERADLRGSRIRIGGQAATVDDAGRPTPAGPLVDLALDARCDDRSG